MAVDIYELWLHKCWIASFTSLFYSTASVGFGCAIWGSNKLGHEIASSSVFFWMDFSCLVTKASSWKPSSALKQHSFVSLADFWGDHYALKKHCEKVCTAQPCVAQKEKLLTEANLWDEHHSWLNSNRKILTQKKMKYPYRKNRTNSKLIENGNLVTSRQCSREKKRTIHPLLTSSSLAKKASSCALRGLPSQKSLFMCKHTNAFPHSSG